MARREIGRVGWLENGNGMSGFWSLMGNHYPLPTPIPNFPFPFFIHSHFTFSTFCIPNIATLSLQLYSSNQFNPLFNERYNYNNVII